MISGPCTTILVFCAILSFCAWIILVCNEKGIHPLAGVTRLIHQPLGELLLLLVVVGGFVHSDRIIIRRGQHESLSVICDHNRLR